MKKIVYKHKLVIGKGAYINIEIRENTQGNVELSMIGTILAKRTQWASSFEKQFDRFPENLYIPQREFKKLMLIWEEWHVMPASSLPDDVSNFVQSLKSSPKTEARLEFYDSFSVEVNGQTLFLDSSEATSDYTMTYKKTGWTYGKSHNVYNIEFRIDESEIVRNFKYHDSADNVKKESLNRRDILSAFECILTDAISGDMDFEDFKDSYCLDHDSDMDMATKLKNLNTYIECKKAMLKLEDVNNIEELSIAFQDGEKTNFSRWIVEDAEVKKPAEIATPATLTI